MARRRGNTAAGAGGAVLSIIAAPYLLAYFYPAIGAVVVIAAFADLILCLVRRGDDEARLLKWQHGLAAWCLVLGLVGLARGKSARDEDAQSVALVEQQRSDRALAA
ncbi:MAG: hypothetical protein JWN48_5121, partial [Myxococcaceae bacterium]|nr:hypothetical protein [Myxococcaceae bacterium]